MVSQAAAGNVELAQRTYELFNSGDIDSLLAMMADDIEWVEPEGDPYGGTYHGPGEVRENIFEPVIEEYETFEVEPERFIDGGDTVVALGTFRVTTEAGDRIESPFAHVIEIQDGHVARFQNYTDTALWQ